LVDQDADHPYNHRLSDRIPEGVNHFVYSWMPISANAQVSTERDFELLAIQGKSYGVSFGKVT
jgi:hypothetical protein